MTNNRPEALTVVGIGELLWDMLPTGKQLGGAPANFVWHAKQLGCDGKVISAVGDDELGREIMCNLSLRQLDGRHVSVVRGKNTGTVVVSLDSQGQPSYSICENVAWDFIPYEPQLRDLALRANAVCVGSLAQRSAQSQNTIQQFLADSPPSCLRIFDVNLRQHYYCADVMRRTAALCNILKFNDNEWPKLAEMLGVSHDEKLGLPQLLDKYELRLAVMTQGDRGSMLCSRDGILALAAKNASVVDTVGAGDSFAAALVAGMLRGWPLADIHGLASDLAAYVCTQYGATPELPAALRRRFDSGR